MAALTPGYAARLLAVLTVALLAAALLATPAHAQDDRYVATDGDDTDNDCTDAAEPCATIDHALDEASDGDTIHVAAGTYTERFHINKSVSLLGAGDGPGGTIIQAHETSALAGNRVIRVTSRDGPVHIVGVWIRHGRSLIEGGGILTSMTPLLSLTDVTLSQNESQEGFGGALAATSSVGAVELLRVTVVGNWAEQDGGGIAISAPWLSITESTFSGNTTRDRGGGISVRGTSAAIQRSTIAGNTGGGISRGAGSGPLTIVNSTLSGNLDGPAIRHPGPNLVIVNSTLTGNADPVEWEPSADVTNTIVTDGCATAVASSGGHNLDTGDTCGFTAVGDVERGNANLWLLADNGGLTETHLPLAGSHAIGAGAPATCAAAPVGGIDQRGVARGVTTCTIGAVEVAAPEDEPDDDDGEADAPECGVLAPAPVGPGVHLAQWSCGDLGALLAATPAAQAFWVAVGSAYAGYAVGAPDFANVGFLALLDDGELPAGTIVLVVQ